MSDTQWPRYMVFQKMSAKQPWQHNGTVHAPDPEMALLNARDVFSRRPDAIAMWVVPDAAIYKVTQEQLAAPKQLKDSVEFPEFKEIIVFAKTHELSPCEFLGTVQARSALNALKAAQEKFSDGAPLWWWLFPSDARLSTEDSDVGPMFSAARKKEYKNQSEYHTVTMMRQLHAKGKLEDD